MWQKELVLPGSPGAVRDQLWLSATHSQEEIPWLKGKADNPSWDAVSPACKGDQQCKGPG